MRGTIESETSLIIPSPAEVLALPIEERRRQLQEALRAPNWVEQVTLSFPDVVNQSEVETQVEILNDIDEANESEKKWGRAAMFSVITGFGSILGGLLSENYKLVGVGFALWIGGIGSGEKASHERTRILVKILRWETLKTGWWMREKEQL